MRKVIVTAPKKVRVKRVKKEVSSLTPNQKLTALRKIKKGLNTNNEFMCHVYGDILTDKVPNNNSRLFDDIPELYRECPDKKNAWGKNSAWTWKDKPRGQEYVDRKKKAIDKTIKRIKDSLLK